jgi:predicted dehydrogenase
MTGEGPRFGLIGTGAWASIVHAPAARSSREVDFVSILGRREETTRALAADNGVQAFLNLEQFLDSVDIVGIAVAPDAQPRFAIAAAEAGKHVLLEKPVALDLPTAENIRHAVACRGLASATFFPQLFLPEIRDWIDEARRTGGWFAARLERFSQVLTDRSSPFHGASWRTGSGALWDVAPHPVALLLMVFGDIVDVSAVRGRGDLAAIAMTSADGAVATLTLARDLTAPLPGGTILHGRSGTKALPASRDWVSDSIEAYRIALQGLAAAAACHPERTVLPDAAFGARVTAVLAAATASLCERRFVPVAPCSRPVCRRT